MGRKRMNARNDEIKRAQEEADSLRVQNTMIQQKVMAAHREAFKEKFPNQVEHCLRLVAERLQKGLSKDAEMSISDCSAKDLSLALLNLVQIQQTLAQR
jgi:hypothetical protein